MEKRFTDSCKDITLLTAIVALATRYMELSQQYNDNIPAKSFYMHGFRRKKGKMFPLAQTDRQCKMFLLCSMQKAYLFPGQTRPHI